MATGFSDGIEDCLETRLNRATNPLQVEENWEHIVSFCDMINKDIDGPQTAVRLITHKIQSPQEKESLFALTTLEACVKNCGLRFQQEIGKFRFINEIIKVISPKYLGNHMSPKVKARCIRLLYVWSESLKHEPKINEAYCMLKKQGTVKEDPVLNDVSSPVLENQPPLPYHPPLPQPPSHQDKNQLFNDAEKSKVLSKLLKSKNPDDLQAANRLIKSMVKQDEERVEKVTRRAHQLETTMNNVKLLSEMLKNYQPLASNESDVEIMKELSENIEKQRPALFKLASDSDEKDCSGAIGEILKVNDEVIQVLSTYDSIINHSTVGKLLLLDNEASNAAKSKAAEESPGAKANKATAKAPTATSLLDEQLLSLDLFTPLSTTTSSIPPPTTNAPSSHLNTLFSASNTFHTTTNKILASINATATTTTSPFHNNILNALKSQPPPYQQLNQQLHQQHLQQCHTATTTSNNRYNFLSDSFNSLNTTTTTSPTTQTTTSSSGLDVLNQMLVKTLNDSGMKSQLSNNIKKVSMKEISLKPFEASPPLSLLHPLSATTSTLLPTTLLLTTRTNLSNNNDDGGEGGFDNSTHELDFGINNINNGEKESNISNNYKYNNENDNMDLLSDENLILNDLTISATTNSHTTTTPPPESSVVNNDNNNHINNNHSNHASPDINGAFSDKSNHSSDVLPTNNTNNSTTTTTTTTNNNITKISNKNVGDNKESIEIKPLNDIVVSLESFKAGKRKWREIMEKDGVTCKLHFSDVSPRDDVMVIAMTTTNTSPFPIQDFTFLATVSKGAKVKVQTPNTRDLNPFNPILPPPLISQIILIANPRKEDIKMKFTINYLLDDNIVTEVGEVPDLVLD